MRVVSNDAEETYNYGVTFSKSLRGGDVVCLHGGLGAGKTVMAKGIAAGLGVTADVTSPTFVLLKIYNGAQFSLYHIDAYRLLSGREGENAGLTDYIGAIDAVTVIEWPENIIDIIPGCIDISIEPTSDGQRVITCAI